MKKAVIAASACFVAGLIGCTISLPMVAKDVIHLKEKENAEKKAIRRRKISVSKNHSKMYKKRYGKKRIIKSTNNPLPIRC